ncbi:E3 ubiquitin-protein ligase ATL4-like [Bidens hawaiensis]|uniref:E3 ubiquitin-protein ligase ATL4-like n=1 Tax=Bidens hawaiensis TaxID=980011 RepID=UPI00404A4D53
MDTGPPSPPLFAFETTTNTTIPHMYYTTGTATNDTGSNHSNPLLTITMIVLLSVIIVSAFICLFCRNKAPNDVVSEHRNQQHMHHHIISIPNNNAQQLDWLPVFTFSSITGTNKQLDCAVCLSKFEAKDSLKRLPCFHAFHVECIDAWLKCNQTCPLCRSGLSLTEQADDIINETVPNNSPSNSFRVEIGTINPRQDLSVSDRSYSFGSVEYVMDESYDIPVESTHRVSFSDDKDEPLAGGSRNWLRDYLDRGSGRWVSTESSRRSEIVDDCEANHGGIGVEISEYFRWVSGV